MLKRKISSVLHVYLQPYTSKVVVTTRSARSIVRSILKKEESFLSEWNFKAFLILLLLSFHLATVTLTTRETVPDGGGSTGFVLKIDFLRASTQEKVPI